MFIARTCAVVAAALLSFGAAAADPVLTKTQIAKAAQDIDACLAKADTPTSCIGLIQRPCDEAISAGGDAAHATCADNETAAWDVLLNRTLAPLPAHLGAERFTELEEVQKAWRAYRDAKCGFLSKAQGAWGLMLAAQCRLDETARRTFELRDILTDPNFAAN